MSLIIESENARDAGGILGGFLKESNAGAVCSGASALLLITLAASASGNHAAIAGFSCGSPRSQRQAD
jgi:hypothetical protein